MVNLGFKVIMIVKYPNKRGELVCGCDEAGRGCLAGPVVAAAVILQKDFKNNLINDSKKMTKKNRDLLRNIIEKEAIAYGVGIVGQTKIDEINILNASFLAMHKAMEKIGISFQKVIVDGNRFKTYKSIPHECIIKGDGKYLEIAAASILAKTYRDEIMENHHNKFPNYNWKANKGYPTKEHRAAISKYGITKLHRKSFRLLPEQLELF